MPEDPIVEEVRAIRDAFARRFDYDVDAIARELRAEQAKGDRPVVSLPAKRLDGQTVSPRRE